MYDADRRFTTDEICALFELTEQQINEYVELKFVDKPYGNDKTSFYTQKHIEQLLLVHKRQQGELSSSLHQEMLKKESSSLGIKGASEGKEWVLEPWTRLTLDDGIELHIDVSLANIDQDTLSEFLEATTKAYEAIRRKRKLYT